MQRIFLVGFMGSGKTAMGKLLARRHGLSFIDLDSYIESKFRKTIAQIFTEAGETGFRKIEKNCLHEVAEFEDVVIATGGGAPCFYDNMDFMNQCGETIYIRLTPGHLAERLSSSRAGVRPLLKDKTGDELEQYITETLQKREPYYLRANRIIEGTDEQIERQITN
ncbi:Shikimate kinase [bioreactor metagenome]|jgi:shikimate kinase|uniref:Shikimate kinase n=1 Tax=bioreactor metagenome TaxID=1076179 RepID=A0A644UZ97_9ZZZZ|nr:shikimate kinase [Paludibacter sp.]